MKEITVKDSQNIYDIACEYYGSIEGVYELCNDNGLDYDSVITAGQILLIDETKVIDPVVVETYRVTGDFPVLGDLPQPDFNNDFNEDLSTE